jgi:hypothetical protein
MISHDGKLLLFEGFVVDRGLPKHRKGGSSESNTGFIAFGEGSVEMGDDWSRGPVVRVGPGFSYKSPSPGLFSRLVAFFSRLLRRREPGPTMSVLEFFSSVKEAAQDVSVVEERAAGYESAISSARRAGQTALVESLSDGLESYRCETLLLSLGMTRFVEEDDVVRFYRACERGLRLDWVRNFVRPIPQEVLAAKERADRLRIFDNYAVLHYDPDGKAFSETEAEREKRKDPILFGLLKGRRRLYFVGDWVDEVCDLTLEQIADKLGREAVKEIPGGRRAG